MAVTANYSWTKPTVGADADTWGTELNTDLDSIDSQVFNNDAAAFYKAGTRAMTGALTLVAGSTSVAPAKFQAGAVLTVPVAHAVEWDGTNAYVTTSGASRRTLAQLEGSQTFTGTVSFGNLTVTGTLTASAFVAGSAAKWSTARNLSFTGDVTGTLSSVDGSAAVSAALTIANGAVTSAKIADGTITGTDIASNTVANANLANMAQATVKGRASGAGSGVPGDLTAAQLAAILGLPTTARGYCTVSGGVVTIAGSTNISSVTRIGNGHYQINLTNAMTDANFAFIPTIAHTSGTGFTTVEDTSLRSTTTAGFWAVLTGVGITDPAAFSVFFTD